MASGYRHLQFDIEGAAALICHNRQLADPLNFWAKALKEVTSKRKKTEADIDEMARLEFLGGLYWTNDGKRTIGIPDYMLEAAIVEASKRTREGKTFKAGIMVERLDSDESVFPLKYKGPADPEELWRDKNFVDRRGVRVGNATVMRTRPIFREWSLSFTVGYLPDVIASDKAIQQVVETAGRLVGLGDYRPRYGRFNVVGCREAKV